MSTISPNSPPARLPGALADDIAALDAGKKARGAAQKMSLETAANSQGAASRTMASIAAFQTTGGAPIGKIGATSAAAHAQLGSELVALEANQPVDIYAIMGLVQKSAQEMRNANREIRASELNAQVGELMSAASDMQKAANFRLAAGIVQGSIQMTSGAVQAYGSIRAAGKSAQAAKPQSEAHAATADAQNFNAIADKGATKAKDLRLEAEITKDVTKLDAAKKFDGPVSHMRDKATTAQATASAKQAQVDSLNERARNFSVGADSASKLIGGAGEIITAGLRFGADSADVSAKRHETLAKLHESAVSGANEMMQQMMDVIRDVKDKLASIDQSRIETNRGIARNI